MKAFIISWAMVGLISMVISWILDMRGKEFKEDYFNMGGILMSITIFAIGYISPIMIFVIYTSDKKYFTRLIYKVSNIGISTTNNNQ